MGSSHRLGTRRSDPGMKAGYKRRKSPARSFLRTRVRRRGTRTGPSGQGVLPPMVDEAVEVVISSAEGELQRGVRVVDRAVGADEDAARKAGFSDIPLSLRLLTSPLCLPLR